MACSHQYDQMLLFRENSRNAARLSFAECKFTMVGSAASGLDTNESDQDIMIEPRNIIIEESSIIYREDLPCYVRIPTNELRGLVPRELVDGGEYVRADPVRDMSEEIFGKSRFKFSGMSKVGKIIVESEVSTDFVPQLKISGLPRTAHSFTTRDRSWPSDDIVSLIINGEFHLAARPAPSNPDPEHDFCLSFSKAEVVLTRTMSVNQVLSIKMLKVIGCLIDGGRGVLTSYKMKTVALWFFEQTDNRVWENDRPIVSMLIKLDQYLKKRFLPHYFVHQMNLLSDASDIVLVQMQLWSFLGYYLIVEDTTGMCSYTQLTLAFFMMSHMQPILRMVPAEAGFNYIKTGHFPDKIVKQQLSARTIRFCPVYEMRRLFVSEIKKLRLSFNGLADEWLNSHIIDSSIVDEIENCVTTILTSKSTMEPLDLFFRMNSEDNVCDSRSVGGGSTNSECSMKNWLTFIDVILKKLNSHGNNIADQVLYEMSNRPRDHSCVNYDVFRADVCKLLDHVTKEIIEFSIDIIEATPSRADYGVHHSLRQATVGDSSENICMLHDAIEVLFLPIEYDIVRRIRGMASTQLFDPGTMEYRCLGAFLVAREMLRMFDDFQSMVHSYNGYLRFMAHAIRGARELEHDFFWWSINEYN